MPTSTWFIPKFDHMIVETRALITKRIHFPLHLPNVKIWLIALSTDNWILVTASPTGKQPFVHSNAGVWKICFHQTVNGTNTTQGKWRDNFQIFSSVEVYRWNDVNDIWLQWLTIQNVCTWMSIFNLASFDLNRRLHQFKWDLPPNPHMCKYKQIAQHQYVEPSSAQVW